MKSQADAHTLRMSSVYSKKPTGEKKKLRGRHRTSGLPVEKLLVEARDFPTERLGRVHALTPERIDPKKRTPNTWIIFWFLSFAVERRASSAP